MRAIATKQPTNDSAKQKKNGDKGRSRSISPLSTGMPLLQRKCVVADVRAVRMNRGFKLS